MIADTLVRLTDIFNESEERIDKFQQEMDKFGVTVIVGKKRDNIRHVSISANTQTRKFFVSKINFPTGYPLFLVYELTYEIEDGEIKRPLV